MKHLKMFGCLLALLLAAVILFPATAKAADVEINPTNFPDDKFREYVYEELDTNGNGLLSQKEMDAVTVLRVSYRQFTSLEGIGYFPELKELSCSYQYLEKLDLSMNTKLEKLDCSANDLTELNITGCTALKTLYCYGNELTELYLADAENLEELDCDDNNLGELDVSVCSKLWGLYCSKNSLEFIYLPDGALKLVYFNCDENPKLRSVDLSNCPDLYQMSCNGCALTKLDLSESTELEVLFCQGNNIKELDIHHIPYLKLAYEDADEVKKYSGYTYYMYDATENMEEDGEELYELKVDNTTKVATAKPTISTQPKSQTIAAGKKVTFKVAAKGGGLSYQWQYKKPGTTKWVNVASAAGKKASYSFTAAARHYKYQYRCKVTNAAGTKISKAVTLTVKTKPVITSPTKATTKTVKKGATVKLTVKADAAETYQWQYKKPGSKKWVNIKVAAGKKATYSFKATLTKKGYKYRCKVKNPYGTVYSKVYTLKVTK